MAIIFINYIYMFKSFSYIGHIHCIERYNISYLFQLPLLLLLLLQFSPPADGFIIRLITETLQNNVAGEPVLHERTSWDFDPEAAKRARSLYYEVGGIYNPCNQSKLTIDP